MKVFHRITTSTIMALALVPPGWYTEALASPPMPYMSALDYVVERTSAWADAVTDTDNALHDLDETVVHDWESRANHIERSP